MTELRDIQKRALAQIRPTGITALGLPTGSGKSILAYAGSDNLRAVVSTPTRALQQQYAHDPRIDCFVLMGRTSTHCVDGKGAVPPASGPLLYGGQGVRHDARLRRAPLLQQHAPYRWQRWQPMSRLRHQRSSRAMARDHDFRRRQYRPPILVRPVADAV